MAIFLHPKWLSSMLSTYPVLERLRQTIVHIWRVALRWPRLSILGLLLFSGIIARLSTASSALSPREQLISMTARTAQYFIDYPVPIDEFGELGRRVQFLNEALGIRDGMPEDVRRENQTLLLEHLTAELFPFIRDPSNVNETLPLTALRRRFVPKSKGIAITTGKSTFRYAAHLIANLRDVLKSKLPIQILYLGDSDLPLEYREALVELGQEISTIDLVPLIGGVETLDAMNPSWSIKPFALLFSTFEQVILLDADDIFFQKPELILTKHTGYRRTGTLLFHDRLVGKGDYAYRHAWLNHQMRHTPASATRLKSTMLTKGYGHEAESGVVVLDKSRLPVLLALLHTCWQNSGQVREKHTYTHIHGDKETYWLGLELCGVPYVFAEQYAATLGIDAGAENGICGAHQAHLDEKGRLLWFNGSLLRIKTAGWKGSRTFVDPQVWAVGGDWVWQLTDNYTACMRTGDVKVVTKGEKKLLERTRAAAKKVDGKVAVLAGVMSEEEIELELEKERGLEKEREREREREKEREKGKEKEKEKEKESHSQPQSQSEEGVSVEVQVGDNGTAVAVPSS